MNTCVYQAVKVKVLYRNHKLCDSELYMIQPLMGVYFKQFCFSKIGGVGGGWSQFFLMFF